METNGCAQAQLLAGRVADMRGPCGKARAFCDVRVVPDLSGIERFVTAVKAGK